MRRVEATLKVRIREIDVEILMLRKKQEGLELALNMVQGHSPMVEI